MDPQLLTEAVGWLATTVLLATLTRQVWSQWRSGSTQGVSHWLFIGQLTASALFFTYSLLLGNWVFVVSNALLVLTAVGGQLVYRRNQRLEARARQAWRQREEPRRAPQEDAAPRSRAR